MTWKRYSLAQAGDRFDSSRDFTVGIEEEFQILDPVSLDLSNRYEELQQLARRKIGSFARGELIASEIEICTESCVDMAAAENDLKGKRLSLFEAARELGVLLGATGTHPFASWKEQRIIDTPHYREVEGRLRYCTWRNVTFGMHVHVGVQGRERVIAIANAMRGFLPPLLALSANSPFDEGRYTYLHSTRTQLFTKFFPRCNIPGPFRDWQEYATLMETLFAAGSISEPTQVWWSVRPHPQFGTLEVRICDCQGDVEDTLAIAALIVALVATLAADYDAGRELPVASVNEVEENFWRAIRYGLDGSLVDFRRRREVSTTAAIAGLLELTAEAQARLGLGHYASRVPEIMEAGNGAQRQIRLYEQTGDLAAVFAETVHWCQPPQPAARKEAGL